MRDDKDHNERLDDFSGYMRQRLEEHRLPVDAGGWDEVEARMNRRARSRGWLWTRGLAAAAVLALVIWLLPSPEKMPLEELSPFQKEISEKAEEMNILPEHPVLPVEPVKKRIAKVLKWEKKAKLSAIVGEKETIREDENFLDNRSFESYPDVSYSLPISFGFTVRKDLSRRIAVESGLMYTYLSTTFKRGGDCPSEVKSSLHYLGIPLNLVVYLWKNQRWNVYLSGGFMMEKGLQAVYSGYIAGNGTTISKSKKEDIHGMQWSVNASVGAAYRFYGDWSLYFEPRFSHYFDCDQPASIRTDKPLGFGLSAGIRYAF